MVFPLLKFSDKIKYFPLLIFGLILCELFIIVITPPSTGYELSIYSAFPLVFWVFFFSSLLACIFLFLICYIHSDDKLWKYGLLGVICNYSIFLFLPQIRGYYFFALGQDDIFAHLTYVSEIQSHGYVYLNDYYPASHLLFVCLSDLGIPSSYLANFFPALFSILFIIFMCAMSHAIIKDLKFRLLVLIISTPLVFSFFHYTFHPFMYSIFLIPLVIFCIYSLQEGYRSAYSILLIILISALIIFHPLAAIVCLIVFAIFFVFSLDIINKVQPHQNKTLLILFFFGGIALTTWLFSLGPLRYFFEKFFNAVFDVSTDPTIVSQYSEEVATSNADISLITSSFIKMYGPTLIFIFLATVCTLTVVFLIYQKKLHISKAVLPTLFIAALIFGTVILAVASIIMEPIRAAAFSVIIAMILVGFFCFEVMQQPNYQKYENFLIFGLVFIVGLTVIFGALNVYENPWVSKGSKQMSYMEKDGMEWLIENRLDQQQILLESNNYRKYEMLIWGLPEYYQKGGAYKQNLIPTHFGYMNSNSLGSLLTNVDQAYMITNERMKQLPFAVSPERRSRLKSFTSDDFFRLNNDLTVDRVYANKEYDVWIIHS